MKTSQVRSAVYLGAALGLLVSIFSMAEFLNASLRGICSVNGFFSCAVVDESGKTTTLGIQDYLWGIGGFVLIFIVAGLSERRPEDRRWAYGLVLLTSAGIALALYFLYVELVEIHALCLVCAATYVFGVLAWVGAIVLAVRVHRGEMAPDDAPRSSRTETTE
jgi:uncharacterized membrane protein